LQALTEFHRQWLHLWKSAAAAPSAAIDAETDAFVAHVFTTDGKLATLLTSPVTFANKALAAVYGVGGVSGDALQKVSLDPAQRFGVLTQLNFLTRQADGALPHPVRRGAVLYEQLLCGDLPPPPDNVPPVKAPAAGVSNRERFAVHDQAACAKACHSLMDGMGLTFESYDGTGKYRTMDAGKPIDASGEIVFPGGTTKAVANARELVQALAASDEVARCVGRQWLRFGLGRRDVAADVGSLNIAFDSFAKNGLDLRELLVALIKSPAFLLRTPSVGEVL
jgi:hypothetical protein